MKHHKSRVIERLSTQKWDEEYSKLKTRNKQKELKELKELHVEQDTKTRYGNALIDHAIRNGDTFDLQNRKIIHHETHIRRRKALESMYSTSRMTK